MNATADSILFVDLSSGQITRERLPDSIYEDFIGGIGIGVRILYERMQAGTDPLGPGNLVGFLPGLLTGSTVPMASKFAVVTKSPLTNTWGEANSGGLFGAELKLSGYDRR